MTTPTLTKEVRKWLMDWEKRRNWHNNFSGAYTTPPEDHAAKLILCLLSKIKDLQTINNNKK